MKFLVLGATGMAGHTIALYLKEQGHDVTAFTNTPFPYCKNIIGDARETWFLKKVLIDENYDSVINCIGLLNRSAEENKSLAVYLNSFLPHFVADTLEGMKTKMIHMSTDCVFSGNRGSYKEKDLKDGETFYDRSKSLGEREDSKNLTFRNSIIGPDMSHDGIGLFNWFMKQHGSINGYTKAMWTGVTTLTLAKAMEHAANSKLCGVYHLVNSQPISKFDLLKLLNRHFKENSLIIYPYDFCVINKSLVNTRTDFSFQVPSYEQMILEMKEWIYKHADLYPHYLMESR